MMWAAPHAGAADGRVLADRRTVAYAGRAQHASDALRVRSTRPVAAAAPRHTDAQSFAALQLFYYETLVVSTSDDDDSTSVDGTNTVATISGGSGDAGDATARSELELLLARADAAAANLRRNVGRSLTAARHPHAGGSGGRLSWRERARRIVRANVRAADALAERESEEEEEEQQQEEEEEEGGGQQEEHMELDGDARFSAASNGNSTGNGDATARGLAIHQILTSAGAASNGHAAPGSGASGQRSSRLLSLSSSNPRSAASSMHYAFTLSSRTLQQIRSRHERRRLRRQQERRRFDHRVAVGFVLAAKQRRADEGSSQSSTTAAAATSTAAAIGSLSGKSSCIHPLLRTPVREPGGLEDLGKDAFSLAYSGKTGRVTSNGRVFLQCEKFGAGDVVGCGVLLDTKTFFFTLNGRLLGMLAATDVHHFDDFVDDLADERTGLVGGVWGDGDSESDDDDDDDDDATFVTDDDDATFVTDDDDADAEESDEDEAGAGDRSATLFEDALYPALSLHGAGECASANFDTFRFDLAGFARQIQKERQQALLLHEVADERDELATDRAIDSLVGDYFLHYGYRDAFETFQHRASLSNGSGSGGGGSGDVRMLDDSVADDSDGAESSSRGLDALSATAKALLDLRHAVRQHIYAYETQAALDRLRAALGSAFFLAETDSAARREGKVLFYARVLCVLDTLQHSGERPAGNGDATGSRDDDAWNVEAAILCAQEQFSGYSVLRARAQPPSCGGSAKTLPSLAVTSVVDDELEVVMSLLLYERREDVPATSAARRFLSPAFREYVADELNVLLLTHSSAQQLQAAAGGSKNNKSRARLQQSRPVVTASGQAGSSSSQASRTSSSSVTASALQRFLVERNALQAQCLRNGCRVFPGNHTVSSGRSGRRSRHRQHGRRAHHSPDAGGNDYDDDDDEQMRGASSSGSDMSSSSSRSENDDDDDEEEEEEEEEE